jgi:hypothetical protein
VGPPSTRSWSFEEDLRFHASAHDAASWKPERWINLPPSVPRIKQRLWIG